MSPRALMLLSVAFAIATLAAADPIELPVELPLTAGRVAVELRDGRVEVVVDPQAKQQVRVTNLLQQDDAEGFVVLEEADGALQISQPHGDTDVAPRLLVRLVLHPGTGLLLTGDRLAVSVEQAGGSSEPVQDAGGGKAPAPAPPSGSDAGPPLKVKVNDSTVEITGVPAELGGTASHFTVENVHGLVSGTIASGELRMVDFVGNVDLHGSRSEFRLTRVQVGGQFALEGGTVAISGGSGNVHFTAAGASIGTDQWAGDIDVSGDDNRIDMVQSGVAQERSNVTGKRNDIHADGYAGALNLDMVGGQANLHDVAGEVMLTGHGAVVQVDTAKSAMRFELSEHSQIKLLHAEKEVFLKLDDSPADIEDVHNLVLRARGGEFHGRALVGRAEIHAVDSEIDLAFTAPSYNPTFDFMGSTRAHVSLPSPCWLRIEGDEGAGDRLTSSGCQVLEEKQRYGAPSPPGSRQPVLATAKLTGAAMAEIRGEM